MSEAPVSTRKKIDALVAQFEEARALARDLDFDAPSSASIERASRLLGLLAQAGQETSIFEVVLGEDGTIEITATPDDSFVTIDISPLSGGAALIVQDNGTNAITISMPVATDQDILRQIERAAA